MYRDRADMGDLQTPAHSLSIPARIERLKHEQSRLAARILDVATRHSPVAVDALRGAAYSAENATERARGWASVVVDVAEMHAPGVVEALAKAVREEMLFNDALRAGAGGDK